MKEIYKLTMLERPEQYSSIASIKGISYFADRMSLFSIENDYRIQEQWPVSFENIFLFNDIGLWIWNGSVYKDSKKRKGKFVDLFQNKRGQKGLDFKGICGYGICKKGYYIVDDEIKDQEYSVVSVNIETNKMYRYKCEEKANFDTTNLAVDEFIYGRGADNKLYSWDIKLNKRWIIDLPIGANQGDCGVNMLSFKKPLLSSKCILINRGLNSEAQTKDGKVYGYSKADGSRIWEYSLKEIPDTYNVVDDKYYISQGGNIIILDANTGTVLVEKESGFESDIGIYPYKNTLICFSRRKNILKVLDNEAKEILQELEIPELYRPERFLTNVVDDNRLFIQGWRADPKVFGASYGIIIIEPYDGKGPISTIIPRPEMPVTEEIGDDGEKAYVITVSHDNLEEVLRFGAIVIKETANKYGYERVGKIKRKTTDKSHKGKLIFRVAKDKLPKDALKQIKVMAKTTEEKLKKLYIHPGAGKKYKFRIIVETT